MVGAQAFKTVLRICCKFSSVYLEIKGVTKRTIAKYAPRSPAGWSDNLSSDSKNGEESG